MSNFGYEGCADPGLCHFVIMMTLFSVTVLLLHDNDVLAARICWESSRNMLNNDNDDDGTKIPPRNHYQYLSIQERLILMINLVCNFESVTNLWEIYEKSSTNARYFYYSSHSSGLTKSWFSFSLCSQRITWIVAKLLIR